MPDQTANPSVAELMIQAVMDWQTAVVNRDPLWEEWQKVYDTELGARVKAAQVALVTVETQAEEDFQRTMQETNLALARSYKVRKEALQRLFRLLRNAASMEGTAPYLVKAIAKTHEQLTLAELDWYKANSDWYAITDDASVLRYTTQQAAQDIFDQEVAAAKQKHLESSAHLQLTVYQFEKGAILRITNLINSTIPPEQNHFGPGPMIQGREVVRGLKDA